MKVRIPAVQKAKHQATAATEFRNADEATYKEQEYDWNGKGGTHMKVNLQLATAATIKAANAKETYKLVVAALKKLESHHASLKASDHPQVVQTALKLQAQIDILEEVRQSLEGAHALLRSTAQH